MFDLHTHTNSSDGLLSPSQLVNLAIKLGIRYLAITDHDSVSGLPEAFKASTGFALNLIPGLELSIDSDEDEIHLLCYFVDINNVKLQLQLEKLRLERENRIDLILQKFKAKGIKLDRKSVEKQNSGGSIGRPHIARAMLETGTVSDTKEAFEKYLKKGADCYVPRKKLSLKDAVSFIAEFGSFPVLAHPGIMKDFSGQFPELLKSGIRGIEAYYPVHNDLQTGYFLEIAKKYDLVVTAGTDFHGTSCHSLATPGCKNVPDYVLENFLNMSYNLIWGKNPLFERIVSSNTAEN